MNSKQTKAAERLRKALEACHASGLRGGVYDSSFWVWPEDALHPAEGGPRDSSTLDIGFFNRIIERGGDSIQTKMILDGGAGA